MRNVNIESEAGAQETLISWCEIRAQRYPELRLLYHIPNGGKRDTRTAIALRRQGVKAGVPDLHLPVARGGYHGLYIELKVGKNKQTDLQKQWQHDLQAQGYKSIVCYGWQQAAEALIEYLESGTLKTVSQSAGESAAADVLRPAT